MAIVAVGESSPHTKCQLTNHTFCLLYSITKCQQDQYASHRYHHYLSAKITHLQTPPLCNLPDSKIFLILYPQEILHDIW